MSHELSTIEDQPMPPSTPLFLGLVAIFPFSILTGIPAIVIGNSVLKRLKQQGEAKGRRQAAIGILLGWISVAITTLLVLLISLSGATLIGINRTFSNAQTAQTKVIGSELRQAIIAFEQEYGAWPIPTAAVISSGPALMNSLCAEETGDNQQNPRKLTFFTGPEAEGHSIAKHANGISRTTEGAHLWDSWGNPFQVEIAPSGEVTVFSIGKDRRALTNDDIEIESP